MIRSSRSSYKGAAPHVEGRRPTSRLFAYRQDGATLEDPSPDPVLIDDLGSAYAPVLVAAFSQPLDPASLTSESVELIDGGGQDVRITATWDGTVNQVVIVPREPRRRGT